MLITEMLARNARMYPNDQALIELRPRIKVRKEITWRQLDERINAIANALMDRGVRKGDRVLHWMMNSINWLECYFGIIRTGAWAVPLNFRFTSQDLKYCAEIAEAKGIILGEEFAERVEAIRSQLSTVKEYIFVGENLPEDMENFEDIISKASPKPVEVEIKEEEGCGLYFTSGTTGAPKPILIAHKNMGSAAIYENYRQGIKHQDNLLILPPLFHTGAMICWLGCLIVGARGTILPEVTPQTIQNIFEAIHKERATVVNLLVPWVMDILGALDRGELKKERYDLTCWRLMTTGAQPCPPTLIKHWKEYFSDMPYQNVYGLSESTGPGCVYLAAEDERKLGAIGKAGFNWEARIVNENGEDVAPGEVGELILRGDGVMKEYYKNPEKTAETIKSGWLYTADMAKKDDEGFIYLVDRKKDVIIYGGENIYPVEIEALLQSHPKIYDVAVIGIPDERLGEIPLAVIDPKPNHPLTEEEVIQFCEENLPRYKRPRRIIFDEVPRNPTGKIDKPRLREKVQSTFKMPGQLMVGE